MSKSLKRVTAALNAADIEFELFEPATETRTAQAAADAVGCHIDQILKSIIFQDAADGRLYLFMTAGGNAVCPSKAAALTNTNLGRADANTIRKITGFAIGGVAPVGHLNPITAFFDPRLLDFSEIWAAAGTPRHVFRAQPSEIKRISTAQLSDFIA